MSTQQNINAAGFKNCPVMLNKENYVPWSSHLLLYAKSRQNGKLIHNYIINGPYVRRMIPEPGDPNREVPVDETFHVQTDDELTEKELKQIEANDQAIQTILLCLPEDIYATVDSYEIAQEIWLQVQQMMKGFDIRIQDKKAKLFNEWERFTSTDEGSIDSYYHRFLKLMNDLKRNKHFLEKIANPLALMATSNNPYTFPVLHQDQPSFNQNYMQQPMPNLKDITDPTTAMNMTLALMAKAFKLNYSTTTNGFHQTHIIVRPRKRDAVYFQTQLLIAQKEEARIQPQAEEFDLMAAAADLDEIEEVNAHCILTANLQQASTSGTQTDKSHVYDSDGSAEVHNYEDCYDNEIFNMFTQAEQYTKLLEPIPKPHQVPQNDNNIISEVTGMEQSGGTVEQHPAIVEETRVLYDSLYHNLAIEVEKVNTVN
nr:hypothetical protein [Tanacetum cinerariifolium]